MFYNWNRNFRGTAFGMLAGVSAFAADGSFCDLVIEACPKEFANKIITVPKSTVALSARMPICSETVDIPVQEVKPPDIMFIIDNSTSMNNTDGSEARFSQSILMLDSLFKLVPKAHVGLTSFTKSLQFDDRDPHLLAPAFPGTENHGAYVPLTRLDTVFANGVRGIDTLKAMLKHSSNGNLTYGVTGTNRNGTDITLGFESALTAMNKSTVAKEAQFIIFLSDGEPGNLDSSRTAKQDDYLAGTGVPTTFTVFFGDQSDPGFVATNTMTTNIQKNGYSATNPKSAIWNVTNPSANLQGILQGLVSGVLTVPAATSAQTATLSKGNQVLQSNQLVGTNFVFQKRLALDADSTVFNFQVAYSYTDNTKNPPVTSNKTFDYKLTVRRTGANPPVGASTACYDAPSIALLSENKPISIVTADNTNLQVQVTSAADKTCTGCTATLSSKQGSDKETLPLTGAGNVVTGNFSREVSSTPLPNDSKLQHLALNDSVVVVFQNPEFPLETVRRAFKYEDISTVLNVAWRNPVGQTTLNVPPNQQFIIASAVAGLKAESTGPNANCCYSMDTTTLHTADSTNFVGIGLTVTREFSANFRIFDNFGTLVNTLAFKLPKAEFAKLKAKDPRAKSHKVWLLWNGITNKNAKAATGAYILFGTVTLAIEPGVAEDKATTILRRRIGLVRNVE